MLTIHGLVAGRIIKRYQRFLADALLDNGRTVTAHCTNTGTMKSVWEVGDKVLLLPSDKPARKLPYTWIACERDGHWAGVDTGIPNKVIAAAARQDRLPGLTGLHDTRTEVRYGRENSRIDVLALDIDHRQVYIEVKNATLRVGSQVQFPDAVTERGLKHLRELQEMVRQDHRAAIVFFINRGDVDSFDAARTIDPAYANELYQAAENGVLVLPVKVRILVQTDDQGLYSAHWSLDGLLPWEKRSLH